MKKYILAFSLILLTTMFSSIAFAKSNLVVVQSAASNMKGDVVELVVDFSGSMNTWVNQSIKSLSLILPKINPTTNVGLRVFGQYSFGNIFFNACTATTQTVPLGKNKAAILSSLNSTQIGGSTPLTYALRQTVTKDFAGLPASTRKKIILVTDGYETCGGNPCAYIQEIAKTRKDIVVDVILVGNYTSLRCLSDATGGNFYTADNINTFRNSMAQSFETKPEEVYDSSTYTLPDNDFDGEPIMGY